MAKINIFNGGLRTAVAAHLISENESVVNNNVNHIPGLLESITDKTEAVQHAKKWGHFFTTSGMWHWSETPKDWVEFQERLYIGNRDGYSTKIINNTEYNLGIHPPTVKPIIIVTDETPEQDQITRLDLTSADNVAADIPANVPLRYRVVNIDAFNKYYVSETEFTIRIPAENSNTNQVNVECEDTNINTNIAIFRFFDNYWRKVYEGVGPITIIDDIYDISANDVIEDYEARGLDGTYQYALTFYNSVDGTESAPVISDEFDIDWGIATVTNLEVSTDPQVDGRRLYRIGGALTTFTLVAKLDNVVTFHVDNLRDDELEGSLLQSDDNFPPVEDLHYMMESYAMLFAADKDKLRFTPIGEPDYWPQTYFLDFPRVITGLAKTPIGILVFNTYETWLVTGTGPLSLAQQLLTGSQGCINGDSVVNIEGAAYWASTDGVCMSNGGEVKIITRAKLDKLDLTNSVNAVVYDEQYYLLTGDESLILDLNRQVIKNTTYGIESFITANDTLYGYNNEVLYQLENSDTKLSMKYRTPKYIGRGFIVPKVYKNIYIFSEGDITVDVYVDNILVQTDSFTDYDNHQLKIPSELARGFSIQFDITGTGTVYEIHWEDGNATQ